MYIIHTYIYSVLVHNQEFIQDLLLGGERIDHVKHIVPGGVGVYSLRNCFNLGPQMLLLGMLK